MGYHLVGNQEYQELRYLRQKEREFELIKIAPVNGKKFLKYFDLSQAQLHQDLFVLQSLNFKEQGFFVEFGATDGISHSNTWLLEKNFGWKGILAEPAVIWYQDLLKNRSAKVDRRCVWSKTGQKVSFLEAASLSTIDGFGMEDKHSALRQKGKKYEVDTVSLQDLLQFHGAPPIIDYLSLDTEGSEFEILKHFDFDIYKFRIISVEHNYTSLREEIFQLLKSKGYKRVHEDLSAFDDWYLLEEIEASIN